MSILSHFNLNSDYTAPKEEYSFDQTMTVSSRYVNSYDSVTVSTNVNVPVGEYFENTTLDFSLSGESSPTPFIVYAVETGEYEFYQIVVGVRKTSNSNYQIYATIQNMTSSGRQFPTFTVRARCHLFVSSFN